MIDNKKHCAMTKTQANKLASQPKEKLKWKIIQKLKQNY